MLELANVLRFVSAFSASVPYEKDQDKVLPWPAGDTADAFKLLDIDI